MRESLGWEGGGDDETGVSSLLRTQEGQRGALGPQIQLQGVQQRLRGYLKGSLSEQKMTKKFWDDGEGEEVGDGGQEGREREQDGFLPDQANGTRKVSRPAPGRGHSLSSAGQCSECSPEPGSFSSQLLSSGPGSIRRWPTGAINDGHCRYPHGKRAISSSSSATTSTSSLLRASLASADNSPTFRYPLSLRSSSPKIGRLDRGRVWEGGVRWRQQDRVILKLFKAPLCHSTSASTLSHVHSISCFLSLHIIAPKCSFIAFNPGCHTYTDRRNSTLKKTESIPGFLHTSNGHPRLLNLIRGPDLQVLARSCYPHTAYAGILYSLAQTPWIRRYSNTPEAPTPSTMRHPSICTRSPRKHVTNHPSAAS